MPPHPDTPPDPDDPAPLYDPWSDVASRWPQVSVVREPLTGRLLGELRYPVIVLRAGSTTAQQRCTLAHELVHLERGGDGCAERGWPWDAREEWQVHREAARRLLPSWWVRRVVRSLGPGATLLEMAAELEVDVATLRLRLESPPFGS